MKQKLIELKEGIDKSQLVGIPVPFLIIDGTRT
jgi:hypothetical protein